LYFGSDHDHLLVVDHISEDGLPVVSGEYELFTALGQPQTGPVVFVLLVLTLHPDLQVSCLVPEPQHGPTHDN